MARQGRPERNRTARSFRKPRRFHHLINSDPVFGTHNDAYSALLRIEGKGGVVVPNAVVYRVETDDKNNVQALHFYDPNKTSTRVTGKTFVLACNGIETPKILLLSKNDENPKGSANSSDQVGRNMMDTPKFFVLAKFKDLVWARPGTDRCDHVHLAGRLPLAVRGRAD